MPSPVGHELAGYIVYDLLQRIIGYKRRLKVIFLCLLVAILPDFDFIPGILDSEPNKYHHGLSHSIVIGIAISVIVTSLFFYNQKLWVFITLFFSVYLSHLLLDLLSFDQSYPYGLQLLWPFSNDYLLSPHIIFSDIRRGNTNVDFIPSLLLNSHNYMAMLREALILSTPIVAVKLYDRWKVSHD